MITAQEFRDYFKRDFSYCPLPAPVDPDVDPPLPVVPIDNSDCIDEADIDRAILDASMNDKATCLDPAQSKIAQLYLTAHYLIMNLRMSSDGIDSVGAGNIASQAVGSVSQSFLAAPQWLQDSPWAKALQETGYGQRYFVMAYPCILSNRFFIVPGRTAP